MGRGSTRRRALFGELGERACSADIAWSRLSVALGAARVQAARGSPAEERKQVDAVLGEAGRLGLMSLQLEVDVMSGDDAGPGRLAALEKEAKARGFALIARKAAVAR